MALMFASLYRYGQTSSAMRRKQGRARERDLDSLKPEFGKRKQQCDLHATKSTLWADALEGRRPASAPPAQTSVWPSNPFICRTLTYVQLSERRNRITPAAKQEAPRPVVSYNFVWRLQDVYRPYRRYARPWRSAQWPEAPIESPSRYRIGHCLRKQAFRRLSTSPSAGTV
jgi:hypothetical protein